MRLHFVMDGDTIGCFLDLLLTSWTSRLIVCAKHRQAFTMLASLSVTIVVTFLSKPHSVNTIFNEAAIVSAEWLVGVINLFVDKTADWRSNVDEMK